MRHELDAIGQPPVQADAEAAVARSFGWRHVATALLLLVTLPVFAAAGAVALAVLPFILAVVALDQLRQYVRPQPEAVPARVGR